MPGVVTAVAISREAKRPASTGKPAVGFMARGPGSASTSANCLPRRSPIVEALRDHVPPGNHRNLATLGLYFGHQSRLLLRCPLPASSTRATISPSIPRTLSVGPEGFRLLSARPPRPHASDRVRPDAYPLDQPGRALLRQSHRSAAASTARRPNWKLPSRPTSRPSVPTPSPLFGPNPPPTSWRASSASASLARRRR